MSVPMQIKAILPKANGGVFATRFHPNGRNLLVGGAARTIRLLNPHTNFLIHVFTGHAYQILSLDVSPNQNHFASAGGDRAIFVWDIPATKLLHKFQGSHAHTHRVNDVAFAGQHLVVSGSYDSTTSVWDLRSRSNRPIQVMKQATDSVSAILALEHSAHIFSASIDGCVRTYDIRSGLVNTDVLPAPVSSMSLTRDRNCILASCMDSSMWLLDIASGEILSNYHGHQNHHYSLDCAVAFDDATVMCGSEDGAFYCWNIVDGGLPTTVNLPPGKPSVVCALDAHPTNNMCVTATHDGHLFLWS